MARFKVIAGSHYEPADPEDVKGLNPLDPRMRVIKRKGDVFESSRPLDEIFPNKFERVTDQALAPVSEERKKMVSQLVASGFIPESDRTSMEQMSDKGFDAIVTAAMAPKVEPTAGAAETEAVSILGTDVTDKFDKAKEHGFAVFRNGQRKYNVTKAGESTVLNPSPLNQSNVDQFIEAYLQETSSS